MWIISHRTIELVIDAHMFARHTPCAFLVNDMRQSLMEPANMQSRRQAPRQPSTPQRSPPATTPAWSKLATRVTRRHPALNRPHTVPAAVGARSQSRPRVIPGAHQSSRSHPRRPRAIPGSPRSHPGVIPSTPSRSLNPRPTAPTSSRRTLASRRIHEGCWRSQVVSWAEGLMDITVVKASHLPRMDYWGPATGQWLI